MVTVMVLALWTAGLEHLHSAQRPARTDVQWSYRSNFVSGMVIEDQLGSLGPIV